MKRRRLRKHRYFGNTYLYENQPEQQPVMQRAEGALGAAQGAIDALQQKRQELGKAVDRQMKNTMDFMKQAIGGMLGFVAVNAVESVIEKTFIGNWGKIATKSISTGSVYLGARMITEDDTVRKAILVGSLINVGLSIISDALAGNVNLGPGLSGGIIPHVPSGSGMGAYDYGAFDYNQGYEAQW